jgi:hypothetical protein
MLKNIGKQNGRVKYRMPSLVELKLEDARINKDRHIILYEH